MTVNINRVLGKGDFALIDADGHIMGRLSSIVAKRLLNGEKIVIINAEKVIITGEKYAIFSKYKEKFERGSQEGGPYFPKHPEKIFKRTVRGMLPSNSRRNEAALSNLRVFIGTPQELENKEAEVVDGALFEKVSKSGKYVTLGDVSSSLGFKFKVIS